MTMRLPHVLLVLSALFGGLLMPAAAAELLMFESPGCPWCARWKQEVGIGYPKTLEGRRAPVRSVDLHAGPPSGISLAKPVQFSPTFVLVDDDGREIGRITGYPGPDFFWGLFGEMARKLPPRPAG